MTNPLVQALTSIPDTQTTNGAGAYTTSLSACLDLFGCIGALRSDLDKAQSLFIAALKENPLVAMRILFYSRDCRGGQGERDVPRHLLSYVACTHPQYLTNNIHLIPVYGRWDDLFSLIATPWGTKAIDFWCEAIRKGDGLASKWAPRESGTNKGIAIGHFIPRFGSPKKYRKAIVAASKTVEQLMCTQKWDDINYQHVPSYAMKLYKNAFKTHSPSLFEAYIQALSAGTAKINASTLYPHDIVRKIKYTTDPILEAQWKALPDYFAGKPCNLIAMCDVSGSMTSPQLDKSGITPIDICVSLGMYIGCKIQGPWHNHIITFTNEPKFQSWKDSDTLTQIYQIVTNNVGYSTNLIAAFDLILSVAIKLKLTQELLPKKIVIFSDMQFNAIAGSFGATAYQAIQARYVAAGYQAPEIVFWNLNGTLNNTPVRHDNMGVCLVSGYSPSNLQYILTDTITTPQETMLKVINSKRYENISI